MNRRGFLTGVAGLLAAPAIVRAGSLMPVSVGPTEVQAILYRSYRAITMHDIHEYLRPGLLQVCGGGPEHQRLWRQILNPGANES